MTVRASVGDRVIRGHREVRGSGGGSPYVVRWGDSGHETLFFPGPDATVQTFERASA